MRSILAAAAMVLTMGAAADAAIVGSGPALGNGQTVTAPVMEDNMATNLGTAGFPHITNSSILMTVA